MGRRLGCTGIRLDFSLAARRREWPTRLGGGTGSRSCQLNSDERPQSAAGKQCPGSGLCESLLLMLWTAPPPARKCQGRRWGDPIRRRRHKYLQNESDVPIRAINVRYRGNFGRDLLPLSLTGFDPFRTLPAYPNRTARHVNRRAAATACASSARAVAQNLGQRIGESPWLAELEDISVGHGVSLLEWRSGGVEHPHDTPPHPLMPSPTYRP
jgi:hypothetical protein